MGIFVGGQVGNRNDFDLSQPVFAIESERDGVDRRVVLGAAPTCASGRRVRPDGMYNLNTLRGEPVSEIVSVTAQQQDSDDEDHELFFWHNGTAMDAKVRRIIRALTNSKKFATRMACHLLGVGVVCTGKQTELNP